MEKPLFDPEEDRSYSEYEKWKISYDAVDRHSAQHKHGVTGIMHSSKTVLIIVLATAILSILLAVMVGLFINAFLV